MKTGSEITTVYFIDNMTYYVYGCWDSETPEGIIDYYDVENSDGECINLGAPFYTMPTKDAIRAMVKQADEPVPIKEEMAFWEKSFLGSASEIIRLAEINGTPFTEAQQAEHLDIAQRLMALCGKLL